MRLNLKYLILSILILSIEVLIALYVRDDIIRPYVGDILVVMLIYCVIRAFVAKKIKALPMYVFLFAAFVEALQFFDIVSLLGIKNRFLTVVIGTYFDWHDILCYFIGALLLFGVQWIEERKGRRYEK